MVLVGVGAVMAVVAWVIVLLSPASEHPLESATLDTAGNGSLTTLAGPQNAVPAAAVAAGRSIVELQATTTHGTFLLIGVAVAEGGLVATTADLLGGLQTHRHGRPRRHAPGRLGGGHGQDLRHRAGQRARGPSGGAVRRRHQPRQRHARHGAHLRVGGRQQGRPALHVRRRDRRRRGHRQRAGLHHAVDHLVARDAVGHRGRAAAQRRKGRWSASSTTPTRATPPPPSSPATWSWVSPTTCDPTTGWCTAGWACRAPTPRTAQAPRWNRCSPAGRPPGSCRQASSSWP